MSENSKGAHGAPAINLSKRQLLASAVAGVALATTSRADAQPGTWDLIVVGGGNAGLPAALFAARRGARVLVIEASGSLGGTLLISSGQMAAAGTKLQKSKGIVDTPKDHYDDIMRISKGTANPGLTKLATEHNAVTFDWLTDNGLKVGPNHPELGTTHEPYSKQRYAWSPEKGGRAILEILERELKPAIERGRVTTMMQTEVTDLITDGSGAVLGVVTLDRDKKVARHLATNTLLTCGGFASNAQLVEQIDGIKKYNDGSYPYSQGIGIKLATSVGGFVRGGNLYMPLFGGILQASDYPSPMLQIFRPWPGNRPPWEIYVNAAGARFYPEDILSHDHAEIMLLKQPQQKAWVVFDNNILKKAPQILNPKRWTPEEYAELFGEHDGFFKADTLADLATKAGIDKSGLLKTVADYNTAQASGTDKLGRKHMPAPISEGPFYAILSHAWGYVAFGGIAVDDELRVIRQDGRPVANLYAAGEVIGAGQTMGHSHCGGMCVTPALTFGRLLGEKMLPFKT
jgi:fumarate reductase flavoprotein subunit